MTNDPLASYLNRAEASLSDWQHLTTSIRGASKSLAFRSVMWGFWYPTRDVSVQQRLHFNILGVMCQQSVIL